MRHHVPAALFTLIIAGAASAQKSDAGKKKPTAPTAPGDKWEVRQAPTVSGFSPASGAPLSQVVISGQHFNPSTVVRFNGRSLRVLRASATQLVVLLPKQASTDAFVIDKPGFESVVSDSKFVVLRTPVVESFAPRRGDPGITVTVTGAHFAPGDQVFLGAHKLTVKALQARRIEAVVAEGALTGLFSIHRNGKSVAESRQTFEVSLPQPVIDGFSPQQGAPGTIVRLEGRHFDSTDWVRLGRAKLAIRSRSPKHFVVVVGKQPSGPLVVAGRSGRLAQTSAPFVVVSAPKIARFVPEAGAPGTRITVYGTHFLATDKVFVGDASLIVRTASPTRIVTELPAGVASGKIGIIRGTARYASRGTFRVWHAPSIASISPNSGPAGTTVAINGANFLPGTSVVLAGQTLKILRKKLPGQLWVRIPQEARTGRVVVVTDAGSAQYPTFFQVSRVATVGQFYPLSGLPGTQVTISGNDFDSTTRAHLGTVSLPVISVARSALTVSIPKQAQSGKILVTSYGRKILSKQVFTVLAPTPALSFTVAPATAKRGSEVTLTLTPAQQDVSVYLDGRLLPKRTLQGGRQIVVTVPGDAKSGFFEVEYNGERYRSPIRLRVR
jgi:hypothetical protein